MHDTCSHHTCTVVSTLRTLITCFIVSRPLLSVLYDAAIFHSLNYAFDTWENWSYFACPITLESHLHMCMSEIKATYRKSLYGRESWYVVQYSQVYTPQTINMIICYTNAFKFNNIDAIKAEIKIQDQCFFVTPKHMLFHAWNDLWTVYLLLRYPLVWSSLFQMMRKVEMCACVCACVCVCTYACVCECARPCACLCDVCVY